MTITVLDYLRAFTALLFVFLVSQTAATVWYYLAARHSEKRASKVRPGVLPSHVTIVGASLIGLAAVAVWQNVTRIGEPFSLYLVINPVLLLMANRGVWLIAGYERRRYANALTKEPT